MIGQRNLFNLRSLNPYEPSAEPQVGEDAWHEGNDYWDHGEANRTGKKRKQSDKSKGKPKGKPSKSW
eukprot:4268345-Prorocentrum_lima.AAC.1